MIFRAFSIEASSLAVQLLHVKLKDGSPVTGDSASRTASVDGVGLGVGVTVGLGLGTGGRVLPSSLWMVEQAMITWNRRRVINISLMEKILNSILISKQPNLSNGVT